jgi:hypothetical protein
VDNVDNTYNSFNLYIPCFNRNNTVTLDLSTGI